MALTYEPIATTTLSSASSTITFSSIPQTYTDLRVILRVSNVTATGSQINFYLNGNSINVARVSNHASAGAVGENATTNTYMSITGSQGTPNSTSPSMCVVDVFNYANTSYRKSLWANFYLYTGSSGAVGNVGAVSLATSAINEIQLQYGGGTGFNTGTMATLYGIKAA